MEKKDAPYTSMFRVAIQCTDFMLIMSQASNALRCQCKHPRKHEQMAAYRTRTCAWQLNLIAAVCL